MPNQAQQQQQQQHARGPHYKHKRTAHLHPTKDHMVVSYGSFIPAMRRSGGQ